MTIATKNGVPIVRAGAIATNCNCCYPCIDDGRSRTDPKDEGNWVPSGSWRTGVSWEFVPNVGEEEGETWYFYGDIQTSGNADRPFSPLTTSIRDWTNICNWWSHNGRLADPRFFSLDGARRATRLPDENSVVFIYTPVDTVLLPNGVARVKTAHFYGSELGATSTLETTHPVLDSHGGAVFGRSSINLGTIDGGALFFRETEATGVTGSRNSGTVNGGAVFNGKDQFLGAVHQFPGIVNGGAVFNDGGQMFGGSVVVNGGAVFNQPTLLQFNVVAQVRLGTVNGGAVFNGYSRNNEGAIFGGATFNDDARNDGRILTGSAVFNNRAVQGGSGQVGSGQAIFNDEACSEQAGVVGGVTIFAVSTSPFGDVFAAPVCNGSAPTWANRQGATCGCG